MILKDNLTILDNTKTQVFTNEPSLMIFQMKI